MSKCSTRAVLPRPVTMQNCSMPAALASSIAYWISGLSTTGSISLAVALVAGRNRVPRPATGRTALRNGLITMNSLVPWKEEAATDGNVALTADGGATRRGETYHVAAQAVTGLRGGGPAARR